MNYCLGKMDPNGAKYLKNGQNFSSRGPNFFIHSVLRMKLFRTYKMLSKHVLGVGPSGASMEESQPSCELAAVDDY